ncbi:hypothetical protein [Proteus columbae]|uniref:hypothetical protein n=1 Tax=Proteus columbae TaxID=1987580 RepID=UPI000C1EAF6E|nr:hypothetical protein [Proteus columbae]
MKIDALKTQALYEPQSHFPASQSRVNKELDPLMATLNPAFYQDLKTTNVNTVKGVLALLNQFDVKNDNNQTLKEKRQVALLIYARQASELENSDNKEAINQALISLLSYQGFYHQFTLDLLGINDNQEDYEEFFKPDSASFLF